MERRLATILAADVAGYSRLMSLDEERTHRALRACHGIIARVMAHHRGRIFGEAGDGLMVEFASPVEAVRAAVEIQNDIVGRALDLPQGDEMRFRIGITLGDIIDDDGVLYGDSVNLAARLEALADPGGICISAGVHEHVEQQLALHYQDIGEQTVKNIPKPVHVYRVAVRETDQGLLSVSAADTFATRWLAPRLVSFEMAHPKITVRLETMSRMVDFAREGFDVGVRTGRGDWPGLKAHKLFAIEFTPLLSPELLSRAGNIASPADLLKLPFIEWADEWWREWFALSGITDPQLGPTPSFQLTTQMMASQVAIAGQGVAILTPAFFAKEIASGRLVQPFDIVAKSASDFWLVYSEARRNSPKICAFKDWILKEAGQDVLPDT
jgi:LysR family glycine cleavage system transcriptional activator